MSRIHKPFTEATVTDAGIVILNPNDLIGYVEPEFEGVVSFVITPTEVTGTLSISAQLQGSLDNSVFVNIDSPVALADGVSALVTAGTTLSFDYYRVTLTGSGTQSTTIAASYSRKSK